MDTGDNTVRKRIEVWITQFAKFGIVGVLNTIIGTTVMFLLYNVAGCNYWISSGMNYIVGSIFSYFANKHFTFHVKNNSKKYVFKFIVNISICYLFAYGTARPLIKLCLKGIDKNVSENIAMVVGMVFFVILNFLGQKFFVFRCKREAGKNLE